MAKEEVRKVAKLALEVAWNGQLPVDPRRIAGNLLVSDGGEYYPIYLDGDQNLGFSGEAFFDEENKRFVCRYKATELPVRSNFTIAHELGHIVLGHVNQGKRPRRDTNVQIDNYDPVEVDANQFAAELLMPESLVRTAVERYSNLKTMAEIFDVSTTAMYYRLKNLNLLNSDVLDKAYA